MGGLVGHRVACLHELDVLDVFLLDIYVESLLLPAELLNLYLQQVLSWEDFIKSELTLFVYLFSFNDFASGEELDLDILALGVSLFDALDFTSNGQFTLSEVNVKNG